MNLSSKSFNDLFANFPLYNRAINISLADARGSVFLRIIIVCISSGVQLTTFATGNVNAASTAGAASEGALKELKELELEELDELD